MVVNLLEETLEVLKKYGKSPKDVKWVGSKDGKYAITWSEFKKIADVIYDNGCGSQEVAKDLVVVGEDWWLERCECDGSEWWEFKTLPVRQPEAIKFTKVLIISFARNLDEINQLTMTTLEKIDKVEKELKRFIRRMKACKQRLKEDPNLVGCKETAALKKASMDLSRVLVELRKPF